MSQEDMSFKRVFFYSKSHTPFKEVATIVTPHVSPSNDYGIQLNCATEIGRVLQNEVRYYSYGNYWVHENMPPAMKGFMTVNPITDTKSYEQILSIGTQEDGSLYVFRTDYGPLQKFAGPDVKEPLIIGSLNIVAPDILAQSVTFDVADFDVEIFLDGIEDIAWQGWNPGGFGPDPIPTIDTFTQEQTPWTDETATNLVFDVIPEGTGGNALKLHGHLA